MLRERRRQVPSGQARRVVMKVTYRMTVAEAGAGSQFVTWLLDSLIGSAKLISTKLHSHRLSSSVLLDHSAINAFMRLAPVAPAPAQFTEQAHTIHLARAGR